MFFDTLNKYKFAHIHPSKDVISTFSLGCGCIDKGKTIASESCQNIKLNEVTTIILDVEGCSVT